MKIFVGQPRSFYKMQELRGNEHLFQNWYERQIEIMEQSWMLEGYNSVLTLLVVADVDGAEDDEMLRHYEVKNRLG